MTASCKFAACERLGNLSASKVCERLAETNQSGRDAATNHGYFAGHDSLSLSPLSLPPSPSLVLAQHAHLKPVLIQSLLWRVDGRDLIACSLMLHWNLL